MGDYNFVLHDQEKFSQHPINQVEADIFLNKIEEANLSDLSYTECPFTWTNKRSGTQLTEQRLDRGLDNEAWLDNHPNTTISNLTGLGFDHNPIILNTNPSWRHGQIPFRFFGPWIDHEDCKSIIADCWKITHKGSLAIKIARKLRDIKVKQKKWTKEVYDNIKTNLEDCIKHLDWITKNKFTSSKGAELKEARIHMAHWKHVQESFWKTKSIDLHIKLGDKNTGYFHIAANKRYRRNRIDFIQQEDGTWIHDTAEITQTFTNHFAKMATEEPININPFIIKLIPATITTQENQNLIRTPEPMEIKNIPFSMTGDKPITPAQFRPISPCNTTYKIISKLIAQRLKPLLPK
ncbi:uncharacterized protein LOC113328090 [Papaver somniferum]|uniref:uncharacterized protein LOC113328090 n=1 Tax=Papaver somniferum TaxID=3469 RepID=UPI000E700B25|nr:uncharacterized protein LOC113328090 [Papaver somniferum]